MLNRIVPQLHLLVVILAGCASNRHASDATPIDGSLNALRLLVMEDREFERAGFGKSHIPAGTTLEVVEARYGGRSWKGNAIYPLLAVPTKHSSGSAQVYVGSVDPASGQLANLWGVQPIPNAPFPDWLRVDGARVSTRSATLNQLLDALKSPDWILRYYALLELKSRRTSMAEIVPFVERAKKDVVPFVAQTASTVSFSLRNDTKVSTIALPER